MCSAKKLTWIAGLAFIALAMVASASFAYVLDQAAEITLNQPVRIPGQVLPAGTYWFSIQDAYPGANRVMQIYNEDRSKLITLVNVRDTERSSAQVEPSSGEGELVATFAESKNHDPATLLDWYYPGAAGGYELVYDTPLQKQLDEETHKTIAVSPRNQVTAGISPAADTANR